MNSLSSIAAMPTLLAETAVDQYLAITRIADAAALAALQDEWNAIAGDIPFHRHEWLATWWNHYSQPGYELFVLLVRNADGQLLGIAPWYRVETLGGIKVLRQLGSGEVASDYVGLFADADQAMSVAAAIARWLAEDGAATWDLIEIDGVLPTDEPTGRLVADLALRGHQVDRRAEYHSWRAPLAETWDGYLASISKSRREQIRRQLRRSVDTGLAVPREVECPQDVARGLQILHDLHQRRRESLGEAGCFASPQFTAFHDEVARRFFDLGRLRLRWLELEGQAAAVEYSLTGGDTIYYYQSGFDPARAEERPGWLSLICSLKAAIDDGYRVFDFLRGDEPYKASLGGVPDPLERIRIVGRSPRARAAHGLWIAGREAKRWAKQGLEIMRGWRQSRSAGATDNSQHAQAGADKT